MDRTTLGIVVNHLTDGIVVDVVSPSDFHVELVVEQYKLQGIHQSTQLQLT